MVMTNFKETNTSATLGVGTLKSISYYLASVQKYLAWQACAVSAVGTHSSNIIA